MTDEQSPRETSPDQPEDAQPAPDARLAALLSVRIDRPLSAAAPAPDETAPTETAPTVTAPTESAPPPTEPAASRPAAAHRSTASQVLAFGVLAVLLATGTGLVYAGTRIIRSSTQGQVLEPIDDPSAPGFEALVDPTPTILVIHDDEGLLDSLTLLSLPDPDGGGGVLMIPARTVRELPIYGLSPIEIAYDLGDARIETQAVGGLIGTAPGETVVVDDARWADLVRPVAPIELDNPDRLSVDGEVRFPSGEIELDADDVGDYLEATIDGESDLARLFRHELFWQAWLEAVEAAGAAEAVPGELDSGIGRFVRTLAAGDRDITTLPVEDAAEGRFGEEPAFVPQTTGIEELMSRLVPFPVSPAPGERARVRLLNGTSDTSAAASIAGQLSPAGVQVVLIGNAATLDLETTRVEYFGVEFRDEAEAIVDLLGVGQAVEDPRPSDAADITVTLGADYG